MAHALMETSPAVSVGNALNIRAVSKSFSVEGREVQALQRISLDVESGEFISLVGPSGCGKSTLLRLIAGLDLADEGTLTDHGQAIGSPSLSRGIVFQDHRLLPWLSVEDNIGLSLRKSTLDIAGRSERVGEMIRLVGLQGFEKALPHQLSGGMSQRAAIARGLAPRPRLLLLDEPFGALDSLTRRYLQGELLRVWEHERITMVMVTHDVEEAVFLSERVVVLDPRPGRIKSVLQVDLPKPRDRSHPEFVGLKERILSMLGVH